MGLVGQTVFAVGALMFVDRINRALLRLIRRRAGTDGRKIEVDDVSIKLWASGHVRWDVPWLEMRRITAFRTAGFIGESLVLALEWTGDTHLVTEDDMGWQELTEALPKSLQGALPYQVWAPKAALSEQAEPIAVFVKRALRDNR